MFRFHACIFLLMTGSFVGTMGQAALAVADDFRVDNAVFTGDQKEPSSRSATIFHDGVVYDCMKTPAETVVFDKAADKFILLNQANRTRAELTIGEVTTFVTELQARVAKNPDPLIKFLADPKFEQRYNEPTGELTLTSQWMSYRLVLSTAESETSVAQYREFSDWYARLNTLLGSRPPFARLAVNAAVADRKAIATQVILSISSNKANQQPITIRSEHQVARPLTAADLEHVAKIRKSMSDYKLIDFEKYRKNEAK